MSRLASRRVWVVVLALAILAAGTASARAVGQTKQERPEPPIYICPMDPEVESFRPGNCPKCGMALVLDPASAPVATPAKGSGPGPSQPYIVELQTTPDPTAVGEPVRLQFTLLHPVRRTPIRNLAVVHERRYHLFVLSADLDHYEHTHPTQQPDGTWVIDVTLPKAGHYMLLSDFQPVGAKGQVVPTWIATAGATGDHTSAVVALTPDTNLSKRLDGMTMSLELPPGGLVAGKPVEFRHQVVDQQSGTPVTDLEPYLGAFGHTLVMSADTKHYVHTHPAEHFHAGDKDAHGGPTLTLTAVFPVAGVYRVWTQVQRGGKVSTFTFTIPVGQP